MPHNPNEKLPSVTKILREMLPEPIGLKIWKQKTPQWETVFKEKACVGTLVHYRILNKLCTEELESPNIQINEYPKDIVSIVENALAMWDSLNLEVEPIEVEQFHKNEKYCGTLDLLGVYEDEVILFDLKTSKTVYDTHLLQLGGYAGLLDNYPDGGMVISIHPFLETNPELNVKTKKIDSSKLYKYTEEFNILVDKWHDAENYRKEICGGLN
jgi:hypothetical protein